jgi:uncharacterized protein YfaS (alpha-2-macroglobulin family)
VRSRAVRAFVPRLVLFLALVGIGGAGRAIAAPRVESFTPEGLAKGVRQVVARFDAEMVPLGDPRALVDAFRVDCGGEPGRARWATAREWVYDFARDLPAGLRCTFALSPDLASVAGARVQGRRSFSFHTGGPAVLQVHPYPGSLSIALDQRFILRVDALPDPGSVERFAALHAAGIPEPIAVRRVEGEERARLIQTLWGRPAEPGDLVLEPVLKLPADAGLELVWGPGVATNGVATAEAQRFAFKTKAPLTLQIHCEREQPEAGCLPLRPITLRFSEPVAVDALARARLVPIGPGANAPAPLVFASTDRRDRSAFASQFESVGVLVPKARYRLELPADLRDEEARPLAPIDPQRLEIAMAAMPPLAKFSGTFGILEAADPVLPVAIRGLEAEALPKGVSIRSEAATAAVGTPSGKQIWAWLRATTDDPRYRGPDETGTVRTPGDRSLFERAAGRGEVVPAPKPLVLPRSARPEASEAELIGIPLAGLGLHAIDIESRVLGESLTGKGATYHASTLALVTNLSVHFKLGRQGSLAWVTSLDRGEPVEGARVAVFDCQGAELAAATTDEDGIARLSGLPPDQEAWDEAKACGWGDYHRGLLVRAEQGADVSFVHTSWNRGIEPWRFDLPIGWAAPSPIAHTVLDRSLFRAGETVHMKHFLREPVLAGLALPPAQRQPKKLRLVHGGSGDVVDLDVEFAADGTATSEWAIPKAARLGAYQVQLVIGEATIDSGQLRVEAYRLPLLRGKLQGPKRPAVAGAPLALDFALAYLAGGPASRLPVELRTQVRPFAVAGIERFEGYAFLRGDVKAGLERWENHLGGEDGPASRPVPPAARPLILDAEGGLRTAIDAPPAFDTPQQVVAEMSFRDPNGEIQTIAQTIPVYPSERLIGLRLSPHRGEGEPLRLDVALVDLERRPVRGHVEVELFERKVYSHRKRLVGGFYAFEHTAETTSLGLLCSGRTDRHGRYGCSAPLTATGQLFVRATARDDAGRLAATHDSLWIPGADDDWYEASDSDRMDLVAEKQQVEPGERARLRVRMPFRKATALVTVEREGVAEAFVTRLSGRDPRIQLKVLPSHAPNVFVSVVAVRGRVAGPAPTAQVDLARPASKIGVTELRVGLAPRTLEVEVEPERERYAVRERVRARVRVRTADGDLPPPGTEIALAVVDEALLELAANDSWNLLDAMHGRRSYDVETFSATLQVVGKRHFGLKARPAGGGGGASATRELFDTLLAWQPRVRLDERGEARVEFDLNDSLSAFRIAAIASGGVDRFGTGYGRLRTTQDLMVLPGVAPVAREGDRVRPEFTVRNAGEQRLDVTATLAVEGLAQTFAPIGLVLEAGEAKTVAWDVEVPVGVATLAWAAKAEAGSGLVDSVRIRQRVEPAVPERVLAAELVQLGGATPLATVAAPQDALPGRGGIDIRLKASLANGTEGIDRFFREYPYGCLEQKSSIAIGLRDRARWDEVMAELPGHLDDDGLARFWPTDRLRGSDVLTAYLLGIAHEAGYPIPEASFERMAKALEAFVDGRITRPGWTAVADLPLRRLAALDALSRYGRVQPEQLASLPGQVELWPTSALLDALGLVGRVRSTPATAALRRRVEQTLATRLTVGGTTVGFSSDATDALDWLLATPETNLNRFLLLAHGNPRFDASLPRLMKSALGRQREGHWATTLANAWGRLALERHAARFEKEPVTGTTALTLGARTEQVAWQDGQAGPVERLPWGEGARTLRADHRGTGRPWAEIQGVAAIPLREPLFAGYAIERSWTPVVQKTPGVYSRGDVVRVRLVVDAQSDFSWVVVDDPIPAGATILGSGLGRDSQLLRTGEGAETSGGFGWGCPCRAYTERTELAYRDYFEFVPKGRVEIEYTLRLNQDGVFQLPPTRVEAMYAPESFGELPHDALAVAP